MRNLTLKSRRTRTSCSVIALATVLVVGATPAAAQSFLGSGSFTHNGGGSAGITTAPNLTTITVNPGSTVIDWSPNDTAIGGGTINFQPAGTTANFLGSGNFAVLNRINPADSTRSISLNGTIQTLALGAAAAANGSLYFYTPGGFVIGANAIINVGSLVLSASPITVDGNGTFINGVDRSVTFGQASQTAAQISIASGAQINALANTSSYVAVVAPNVIHNGTINNSGSTALVAAEAATINFSPDGLFDIQVTSGTTSSFGISTSGDIGGAASSGAGVNHRIHLVAVPKNQALTMVIGAGADLGFDVAGAANVDGNTVVLSAGHDIVDGEIAGVSAGSTGAAIANLEVRDSNFTSAVVGEATGFAHLFAFSALNFRSDVAIHADGEIWFSTQTAAGTLDVDGSLTLSTERFGSNGQAVTASIIDIYNFGGAGRITVDGLTTLNTNAHGGSSNVAGVNGGAATGGEIDIIANNSGTIELLGGLTASADGYGGTAFVAGADGGAGTGGDISVRTGSANGILRIAGGTNLSSNGYGGDGSGGECFACDGDGGAGQGGEVRIYTFDGTGSTMTISGALAASADGVGGAAAASAPAIAGIGTGGVAALYVGTGGILTHTGSLSLQAEGLGGDHSMGTAGAGYGGLAVVSETVDSTDGTLTITGNIELSSDGTGGSAFGAGGIGGQGFGGTGGSGSSIVAVAATTVINGSVIMHSTGTGGNSANGTGGTGHGGESRIRSESLLTINGNLMATADALGGGGLTGGVANGGNIRIRALAGGDLNLNGESNIFSTDAAGGAGTNGNGGNAFGGGLTDIFADGAGSVVDISGATTISSNGIGGESNSSAGGIGRGGDVDVYAQGGGTVSFDNNLVVTANGTGGGSPIFGGNAFGGSVTIMSTASLQVDGSTDISAEAIGGPLYFTNFIGDSTGNATGGTIDVFAGNGTLTLIGGTTLSTDASGGLSGTGGTTRLFANSGGTVDLQSTLVASAIGAASGTRNFGASGFGGIAQGGAVRVQATAGNASVTVAGDATLDASGVLTNGGECFSCAIGGNATGGTAWANSFGAATASLEFTSNVTIYAQGRGGGPIFGNGGDDGNGQGGEALLQASAGSTLTVGGDAVVNADAFGGHSYQFDAGVGGNAVGGTARIQAFNGTGTGGTIDIEGGATVSANANGGGSSFDDGQAGNGVGGTAQLYATNGTVTIGNIETNGGATVSADGSGGNSDNGAGGNGTGGTMAEIAAVNGDITIAGFASVSASGEGGDGYIGGDGLGSGDTTNEDQALWTGGARIFAQNGDIVIAGGAGVSAVGSGGDGGLDENGYNGDLGGNGGSGTGGWATIQSANGNAGPSSISIDSGILETSGFAIVTARGTGGDGGDGASGNAGGDGGDGGAATGGRASITAAAGNGAVNIGVADLDATALGGSGGRGGNGDGLPGGNGGNGGDANGGIINVGTESGAAQAVGANNGVGTYGSIFADSSATGGSGGDGNFGSTSGAGGNGGDATGGASILLVRGSLLDVDNVSLFANATGGNGGSGDGETSADGNGGNATIGGDFGVGVIVTGRFQIPSQRGTLDAGSINGTAIATAGLGEIDGLSQTLGGNGIFFSNADGAIGSIDFLVQADGSGIGAIPDPVVVRNGDVEIEGLFRYITSGSMSLYVDNGSLTAGDILWHANDFAPDVQYGIPETVAGTFFAGSFDISTENNFLTTANLDSVQSLTIVAPGAIQIGNLTGDNDIVLTAQSGEIEIGNVDAGGGVSLDADDFVSTGNVVANGTIDVSAGSTIGIGTILNNGNTSLLAGVSINVGAIDSGSGAVQLISGTASIDGDVVSAGSIFADSGDDLFLGNLTAPGDIELVAAGDIIIGNALAGEYIDLDAGGYIDGGSMTAGASVYAAAGESVDFLDISAGIVDQSFNEGVEYNVGILAGTTIETGDIAALDSIGLGAIGDIYTGNIEAGDIFLALSGGNMSFGEIDAGGPAYFADDSMIALGGDPTEGDFDPTPILTAVPTVSGGSITLRGPVTAGGFTAAAGTTLTGTTVGVEGSIYTVSGGNTTLTDLTAGTSIFQRSGGAIAQNDLDAGTYIDMRSTGGLSLGDLVAGDYIDLRSTGAIGLGNATSGETINLLSGISITGGMMTAGDSVLAEAMGAIQLGAVTAGITDPSVSPSAEYAARFSSGAAIVIGDVTALGRIGFGSVTDLTTGNLDSGEGLMALVGGNMATGTIDADDYVYIGNNSMAALGGTFLNFNRAPILALSPVATGGSIAIGAVDTGNFQVAAGTTLTGSTINGAGLIDVDAGSTIDVGDISNTGDTLLTAGTAMTVGSIDSGPGSVTLLTGTSFILGDTVAAGSIYVTSGSSIQLGDLTTPDQVEMIAATDLTVGNITAGNTIDLNAGGDIDGGNLIDGDSIYVDAGGSIMLLNVSAGIVSQTTNIDPDFDIAMVVGTTLTTGDIEALDNISLGAQGNIYTGTIDAGGIFMALGGGNMSFGAITAGGTAYFANSSMIPLGGPTADEFVPGLVLAATPVASGGSIELRGPVIAGNFRAAAGTTLTGQAINSGSQIIASSGGNMTLGALLANNDIRLTSGGNLVTAGIESGDDIALVAAGSIATDEIFAYDDITADAGTSITTDDITGNTIDLFANGAISTGNLLTQDFFFGELQLSPGTSITVESGGNVVTGDIDALDSVAIFGGSITTGNIMADESVGLFTPGDLTVGTINAGADIVALVGDDASFGAITTPGRFFLGGYDMFDLVGDGEDFDPSVVFDTDEPSATGGSAIFAGLSSAESFTAYVGEDTTIASLATSDFVDLDTGDLLSISGAISGGYVSFLSSDIAIGQAAQINAPEGISFLSINSVGTFIGDNIPGETGYRLSQAELDRVNANQLEFEVQTERGAAGLMRLGNLDLEINPGAEDDGNVEFSISSEDEEGGTGIIRVVGNVNVTLGSEQMVEFEALTFEIDAATGSLALTDTLGALSGILSLEASNIFIASGDILTRLEANPQYDGFREELNAPAAVQRPDGVLRAALVTLGEDAVDLENILIQNTGTTEVPAGFLVDVLTFASDDEDELPPAAGSINMVINGQVQTESGTVTGIAVRDGLVEEFGAELIGIFVAGSTINGCPLTGACIGTPPPPPPPPVDTITPTDVQINDPAGLGDGLFGNELDIDDGEDGDGGDVSSPIVAPVPLFDSRPLTADGDIDDPVSGAGNPSLIGTSEEEVCETNADGSCKTAEQGDKK